MTDYTTFIKHAKKIANKEGSSKPILECINHRENRVDVTNGHTAYILMSGYEGEDKLVKASSLEETEGNYPDIERVFPTSFDYTASHITITKDTHKAIKALNQACKLSNRKLMTMEVKNKVMTLRTDESPLDASYILGEANTEDITIHMNGDYVEKVLALLTDGMKSRESKEMEIGIVGKFIPVTIKCDNVHTVISPCRKF